MLAAQLRKQGYAVEVAVDGEDGVNKAQQINPDLIIMDIMMPKMDGFSAARAMRGIAKLKATPIILLSALGGEEDIIKGIECGADDYLIKPFKAPELSAKVKMLIRKSSGFTNKPEEETVETNFDDKAVRRFKETGQVVSKEFAGFQIVDKLGQGGSGTVYRAIEPINLSPVALKVVSPLISRSPGFVERFQRSSEISIKLRHPNIVRCFTVGEYQGVHFLTQELVEGPTLDSVLEKQGPMDELRGLRLMRQMADALKYMEEQNLIHRDIKPSNIFAAKDKQGNEVAKLADFGLSRAAEASSQTVEGHVLGTPHYISPEQAKGEKTIDVRGDLYSLAATFYHLMTGKTPFETDNLSQLLVLHIGSVAPEPRTVRADLSQETSRLLMRFLAKTAAERCTNMTEALAAIDAVIATVEKRRAGV